MKKYQIFISSTYIDLVTPRQKVMEAILNSYHLPVGMEMFSADDDEQWEIIKETIDTSDYYVVIIGHRYGALTAEGISYTEKEYDYAKEKGIPILSFIRERNVPTKPEEREDDPKKQEKLKSFIEKAKGSKLCNFWATPDELSQQVLIALNKIFQRKPGIGWVRADQALSADATAEILQLSRENRQLREEIEELKKLITTNKPELQILLNGKQELLLDFQQISIPLRLRHLQPISLEQVPDSLKESVQQKDVDEYNSSLPSAEEVQQYLRAYELYERKKDTGSPVAFTVVNKGTAKANGIYIDIKFPKEIMVLDKFKLEDLEAPKALDIPKNPIEKARQNLILASSMSAITGGMINYEHFFSRQNRAINPKLFTSNDKHWTRLEKENNEITIGIADLIHTRRRIFDEEYVLVPLQVGSFEANISVICEEYSERIDFTIPITVSAK